jgi:AcrR family transcriptional regulator
VFAARGYGATALDEIVARARVSRTTFYAFFESKEECLLAVYRLGRERIAAAVVQAAERSVAEGLTPLQLIRSEVHATLAAYAADPAMARIVLIETVAATPATERAHARARNAAAEVIQRRMEQYPYWNERPEHHRRAAALATMAAIGEPLCDLVAAGRLREWEALVAPVSEFIGRALIDPRELS